MKMKALLAAALMLSVAGASAADFSPASWPPTTRQAAERQQTLSWAPVASSIKHGRRGMITATVSPIAIEAGLDMLRKGGSAADAAASVALTQVCTELGSVVSYAGIMTVVYYDAKSGRTFALDAGYGTWSGETNPATIPATDVSMLTGSTAPALSADYGRQVLVPGFMAGIEALQKRFGRFTLRQSLQPAIWYAENGITLSPTLAGLFQMRRTSFERTEEGRRFLAQSGRDVPIAGDIFKQSDLASTLRRVARNGAAEMYKGSWATDFVQAVRRDGGKADMQDLARYRPIWSVAAQTEFFGHTVLTNSGTSYAPYQLLTALNAVEAMKLDQSGPYWRDAKTMLALSRLGEVVAGAPVLQPQVESALKAQGADTSPAGQQTKFYGAAMAAALPNLFARHNGDTHHSNAIVVVDREGNIAVMTHTINSIVWGDTGIVVGGIPLPDSAGFQQARLAQLKPGDRLPNEIVDFVVLDTAKRPVLAGGSIGTSLLPEVLRIVVSVAGQRQFLSDVVGAPPLLINPDPANYARPLQQRPVLVPEGAYNAAFLDMVRSDGTVVVAVPQAQVSALRGTVALIGIDGETKSAPEAAGVMVYAGAE